MNRKHKLTSRTAEDGTFTAQSRPGADQAPEISKIGSSAKLVACVQGSTNVTNGIPISFKVLPLVGGGGVF